MWSDQTPPDKLRDLIRSVRSVLPEPSSDASGGKLPLPGSATVEQVAELLRTEAGFAWVTGGTGPCLLSKPLATVSYSHGQAVIVGPEETVQLQGQALDILRAVLEAWRGPAGAKLAGFLSYDLASEIEDLGSLPPDEFAFPGFY